MAGRRKYRRLLQKGAPAKLSKLSMRGLGGEGWEGREGASVPGAMPASVPTMGNLFHHLGKNSHRT